MLEGFAGRRPSLIELVQISPTRYWRPFFSFFLPFLRGRGPSPLLKKKRNKHIISNESFDNFEI